MGGAILKKRLRRLVSKAIPYPKQLYWSIRLKNFSKQAPLLIYQMGKVGSKTIYRTLQQSQVPHPVYHVHYLTTEWLKQSEEVFSHYKEIPLFIPTGWALQKKMRSSDIDEWLIITVTREPISWEISNFFQSLNGLYPHFLDEQGHFKNEGAVIDFLLNRISSIDAQAHFAGSWFSKELKETCGIDALQYPFDHEKGYTIVKDQGPKALILRQEDMRETLVPALEAFFDRKYTIHPVQANVTSQKSVSALYEQIKAQMVVSEEVCRRIYDVPYVQHFYTPEMIDGFISKWSRKI